ncbi:hypothetical protein AURANDRAFT_67991 [Aureococcus anophagefferens]|uniref:Ketosynthase family 3 (KS3) domain-containing protein n=1 Tax=Aureococcus anophagefferens TaxID=44056 RepID=F0YN56_AURAN|nr:hypothetical protein AURANDRAFT_67991 [Aureococcus anophagefferens]EGB03465.1 hypothetical protein AURANDRAFT_67991 [Aureococcus anophagefferens]|eukprot:XP_009041864.1 hypothetical protein AURANDRAFT_67991 [Aureococcus anophagefferens]
MSAVSVAYGNFFLGELNLERVAWGMSFAEVSAIDPQQLILLEICYVVFSDMESTDCRAHLFESHVGVYLGISGSLAPKSQNRVSVYAGTSNAMAVASGRISYTLGLTGPCFPIDTACSASLIALHVATSAMQFAECKRACACGEGLLEMMVGAAVGALNSNSRSVSCASLKSNSGHLEPSAAAAGLVSLILMPLIAWVIAVNALNVHLSSITQSSSFQMPAELVPPAVDSCLGFLLEFAPFFGGDATDAGALLGELRVEPQIEILAAASAITPNSIFQELSKHADTINISIGIGEPGPVQFVPSPLQEQDSPACYLREKSSLMVTNACYSSGVRIIDDVNFHRIKFGALVLGIRTHKRILATQVSLFGINRRLGALRHLQFADEHRFQGTCCYGVENEITHVELSFANVLIVGAGAFAAENVRTAFERGASRVAVFSHAKAGSQHIFAAWNSAFEHCCVTKPECWLEGRMSPHGHTVSVSDIWLVAHYYGLLSTTLGEVQQIGGEAISCDMVVKCTGYWKNERAEAILDNAGGFQSPSGSSYLEAAALNILMLMKFFESRDCLDSEGMAVDVIDFPASAAFQEQAHFMTKNAAYAAAAY